MAKKDVTVTVAAIELQDLVDSNPESPPHRDYEPVPGATAPSDAAPGPLTSCLVILLSALLLVALALGYWYEPEFLTSFIAGGVAGAVAKTLTAPVERVKLLIQMQDAHPAVLSGTVDPYSGALDCFWRVAAEQGLAAFWRGNLANIARYFPTQAFNFAFKDSIKGLFPEVDKGTDFWKFFWTNVAAGGLAGAASLIIVYPLDYARTLLAADPGAGRGRFTGLLDCLRATVATSGFSGLYAGLGVSVAGIVPYRGFYFGLFDTLSAFDPYRDGGVAAKAASLFVCAQASAVVAGYIAYPFDTVRRRLQMQSCQPPADRPYRGAADCLRKIVTEEGALALFKGANMNAIRTLGAAMVLVIYSEITDAIAAT